MGKLEMTRNIRKIDFKVTTPVVQQNESNPDLTFRELATAWLDTIKQDNEHCQLRKWLDLYGDRVAWSITTAELDAAGQAMLEHGYSAATVNRNISTLGSMYKWIAKLHRAPAGFTSPTINAVRHTEAMRVITIEAAKVQALRNVSLTFSDKRFALFVNLLADTGARKFELLERGVVRLRPGGGHDPAGDQQDRRAEGAALHRVHRRPDPQAGPAPARRRAGVPRQGAQRVDQLPQLMEDPHGLCGPA
jgi:hypothetical protein